MQTEALTKKRLTELSKRAYTRGYTTYSDFLNADEISILLGLSLPLTPVLYGGYPLAERCIAGFGETVQTVDFPLVCLRIEPLQQKFSDTLNHRDFLGALMNLGIQRQTLGDIYIQKNCGYVFCLENISAYITENLMRIKHTSVQCSITSPPDTLQQPTPRPTSCSVSSLRADAIVAAVFHLSRNSVAALFKQEKIFLNARICQKESALLKEGDIVSVRGYGKCIFQQVNGATKKGRLHIEMGVFQ